MRVLVAGIIGGIVMFIWGAIAHTALPLGMAGMRFPAAEDKVLVTLQEGLGAQPGIYILPSFDPAKQSDQAAMAAYGEKARHSPYAFMVYLPQGDDLTQMGPQLARQWASDTLSALALAFVMGLAAWSFGRRVTVAAAVAVFAWLSNLVPYWNWYRFPTEFTLAALVEQLVGWILAGAAMAWWLARAERKRW